MSQHKVTNTIPQLVFFSFCTDAPMFKGGAKQVSLYFSWIRRHHKYEACLNPARGVSVFHQLRGCPQQAL